MKKNIIITGGDLYNKGAQSMTFVIVNEVKRKFPNHEIILWSSRDYKRSDKEKNQYAFKIFPDNIKLRFFLAGGIYRMIAKLYKVNKKEIDNAIRVLEESDMVIDISGYALGSNWGFRHSLFYILKIATSKKYGIKTYLMPQSFGPFRYDGIYNFIMNVLVKKYMKYPEMIYAREKEGYDLLTKKYKLTNVKLSPDLVLINKGIDINNIYKNPPQLKTVEAISESGNVAIIPNMKNFAYGNKQEIIELYEDAINKLIEDNKKVFLVRHSFEDIEACELIKDRFANQDNVILLSQEFSCVEYDHIVKNFDYLIASRYHSIIHAYKNSIPCIALGWATKYHELLGIFKQGKYIFDVRQNIDFQGVSQAIDNMNKNHKEESKVIKNTLEDIQKSDLFNILEGK